MRKIHTVSELSDIMDGEFSWRLKELADFKFLLKQTKDHRSKSIIRAGVPLTYAHWEGFVKVSSQHYLSHVVTQKIKLRDLKSCIIAMSKKALLEDFKESNRTESHIRLIDELTIEKHLDEPVKFAPNINTKANLNSKVFHDITQSVGIDSNKYSTKFKFIDESLLKRRNEIAHGDYIDLDRQDFINLIDNVIVLLRSYKTDIENLAALKDYLR
jgi:hypothetical protein